MTSPTRFRLARSIALLVLVSACGKPSADESAKKADAFLEQGRTAEAILEYRTAVQAEPRRADIRQKLADVYLRASDRASALREYVRIADLRAQDVDAQLKAGSMLLESGQFEDAKARANAALVIDAKNVKALILLGNALAGLRDLDGAMQKYQQVLALDPVESSAYLSTGAIQMAQGNVAEAEASMRRAVEVTPTSVEARLALASVLWSTGRTAETEAALKDALTVDRNNPTTNRALGTFYMVTGRAADAEPFFKVLALTAKTPVERFALADYYLAVKNYTQATALLKELTKSNDTYVGAATRLAASEEATGMRSQALARLRETTEKYPKETLPRVMSAQFLLRDQKFEQAKQEATAVLQIDSSGPEAFGAYFVLGAAEAALDRFTDAVTVYEEALRRQPRSTSAMLALAKLHLHSGAVNKATPYLQQVLQANPRDPEARSLAIRIDIAQSNTTKADAAIAALQKDYPTVPVVLNLVAAQQLAKRQVDLARASYAKAAELAPDDFEAVQGLVRIDLARGRTKEAIERIDAALKRPAPSNELMIIAARTYLAAGQFARGEEVLNQAIALQPARLEAYGLLGQLYARRGQLGEAVAKFRQVAERDPKSVSALTMLAMLAEAQGNLPEAEKQYQHVLAVDPEAPVAANNLAMIYLSGNRNLDQALQLAQAAHRRVPNEPHINDTLGWIYVQKKLASSAVPHLEASVKVDATDPVTQYHLGVAYVQTGDWEKARATLRGALALKPDFEGASEARKLLASLGA